MDAFLSMLALLCCAPLLYVIIVEIECDIIEWKYRQQVKRKEQRKGH